jgi:hypothetical protein
MLYNATVTHDLQYIHRQWQFFITTKNRKVFMVAGSQNAMEEWMEAINKNIAAPPVLECKWSNQVHDNLAINSID